jgi:hypothetical protein
MRKTTRLSNLIVIPETHSGKVIIMSGDIYGNVNYTLVKIGKYCHLYDMPSGTRFDPSLYNLLETDSYTCIADRYSSTGETHDVRTIIAKYPSVRELAYREALENKLKMLEKQLDEIRRFKDIKAGI